MRPERIDKSPSSVPPNLADYEAARASFSWAQARSWLDGLPGGGLNIAYEAVTRHARGPRAQHPALRWLGKDGPRRAHDFWRRRHPDRRAFLYYDDRTDSLLLELDPSAPPPENTALRDIPGVRVLK